MNFNREDFGQRDKKKRSLLSTPNKFFNPVEDTNIKLLSLSDIATAIEDVAPESTVFTAVPKPKVDFLKEILDKSSERPSDLASICCAPICNNLLQFVIPAPICNKLCPNL